MKPLVHSHTSLASFNLCPRQWHHRYVLRDVPYVESEAMRWGNQVHKALENRCGVQRSPLPEGMEDYEVFAQALDRHRGVQVEWAIGMARDGEASAFFDPITWFRGKVDITVVTPNLTAPKTALIIDWKTGKRREDPTELEEHAMLLKARWPSLEGVKGAYVWLKEKRMGEIHKLDPVERLEKTKRTTARIEEQLAKDWFPPHENPLCNFCSVESCEFRGKWRR